MKQLAVLLCSQQEECFPQIFSRKSSTYSFLEIQVLEDRLIPIVKLHNFDYKVLWKKKTTTQLNGKLSAIFFLNLSKNFSSMWKELHSQKIFTAFSDSEYWLLFWKELK